MPIAGRGTTPDAIHLEHIRALRHGGRTTLSNLAWAYNPRFNASSQSDTEAGRAGPLLNASSTHF
jgi:hypothetical protein